MKGSSKQFDMVSVEEISSIFLLLCDLAKADGIPPLNKLPGLWERVIDDQWTIAVNGHEQDVQWQDTPERMGCKIPPFHAAITFNGWLAGLFSPHGGMFAAGSLANEETFSAAVHKAIGAPKP